jgi:hypothetical protein
LSPIWLWKKSSPVQLLGWWRVKLIKVRQSLSSKMIDAKMILQYDAIAINIIVLIIIIMNLAKSRERFGCHIQISLPVLLWILRLFHRVHHGSFTISRSIKVRWFHWIHYSSLCVSRILGYPAPNPRIHHLTDWANHAQLRELATDRDRPVHASPTEACK